MAERSLFIQSQCAFEFGTIAGQAINRDACANSQHFVHIATVYNPHAMARVCVLLCARVWAACDRRRAHTSTHSVEIII